MSYKSAVRFPGILGTISLAFYLAWNVLWLARGGLPPSILIGVFGVPAPTTGMTRSSEAFLAGRWNDAFFWNPFTLLFYVLLAWTFCEILGRLFRKQSALLSKPLALTWAGTLSAAWITKLAMGPQWW